MTRNIVRRNFWLVIAAVALGLASFAQESSLSQVSGSLPGAANLQAVSATGLLPVYGIELRLEKGWVDAKFPSNSAAFSNSGVSPVLQRTWDSLKAAGFNMLRVSFDTRDAQAPSRLANLCAWAKANNVKLLVVLQDATQGDYDVKASAFVKSVASTLRSSQISDAYLQIAAYQLDDEVNNPGVHGPISSAIAQQLSKAAQSIRAAEREALQGTGMEVTPLVASVSFDYELIRARAIAGAALSDAAYKQAYSSLSDFLKPLASTTEIDLLSVSWFPGTISAGKVDKPPELLRNLTSNIPGKQIIFTTGFSVGFASQEEQKNYYTMTFANLGDLRATTGGDSPFMGIIFREATNGKTPTAPKGIPQQMKSWDWPSKADELVSMWNGKHRSEEMMWWWETVRNTMGLMTSQENDASGAPAAPGPAQQALGQIATAVSEYSASSADYPQGQDQLPSSAYPRGNPNGSVSTPSAGTTGGQAGGGFKDILQGRLTALLDAAIQRVNAESAGIAPGGSSSGSHCYPGDTSCSATGQYPHTYPGASSTTYPSGEQYPNTGYPNQSPTEGQQTSDQYPGTNQNNPRGSQLPGAPQYPGADSQSSQTGQYPQGSQLPATDSANSTPDVYPGNPTPVAPGSIVLSKEDALITPSNPQVGQDVNVAAKIRNQGSTNATGLIVLASDQANTVLAQADGVDVAQGSASPVTLQFVPTEPQSSLPITLHVSDALGNEIATTPLNPISIASLPGDDSGTGGGATGGPGASANVPGHAGVSTPGISTKFIGAVGIARMAMVPLRSYLVAGEPVPVMANMSNPFAIPMRNINARLLVDGVAVRSQTVPVLLPHQSRSLMFPNVIVSKPGTHEIRVVVEAQRGNAKPQTGYLISKMTFSSTRGEAAVKRAIHDGPSLYHTSGAGSASANTQVRSITAPGPNSPPPTPAATAGFSGVRPGANVRSIAPARVSTSIRPPSQYDHTESSSAARPSGPRTIGSGRTTGSGSNFQPANTPKPFVSLNANEISYGPPAPQPGQPVTFNVIVRNSAGSPAARVRLLLRLYADGKLVAMTQPPLQFFLPARGAFRATWRAAMPSGNQVQLLAVVAADGDANPTNKQVSIRVPTAVPPLQRRMVTNPAIRIRH